MCHGGVVNLLHYYRTCTAPMPAGSMFFQTMPFIFGEWPVLHAVPANTA